MKIYGTIKKYLNFKTIYDFLGVVLNTNPLRHGYGGFYVQQSILYIKFACHILGYKFFFM